MLTILNWQSIWAQPLTESNSYLTTPFVNNPAVPATQAGLMAYASARQQWTGVANAPRALNFGLHAMMMDNMGAGLRVSFDQKGLFENMRVDFSYAYRIDLDFQDNNFFGDDHFIAAGLAMGLNRQQLDQSPVRAGAGNADPVFQNPAYNNTGFSASFGMQYRNRRFRLDLAMPYMIEPGSTYPPKMLGMVSYDVLFSREDWMLTPSVLYRLLPQSPDQVDVNMRLTWTNTFWVQATYRTNHSLIGGGGVLIKEFGGVGYSYEASFGELASLSQGGGHEIVLFYRFYEE